MELWEINMNHVSKMVIFFHIFIYTCNIHTDEYLILIIDIYFIEDKKKFESAIEDVQMYNVFSAVWMTTVHFSKENI